MTSIRVVCRFRPQNKIESAQGGKSIITIDSAGGTVKVKGESEHSFNFDTVFPPDVTQKEVYDNGARPVIEDVMQGYNGTLFVYGQTSSGKTHTMQGPSIDDQELKGIIPRMINTVFEGVMNADENMEFLVKASYLEIYMEHIRDLLDSRRDNLKIREDKAKGIWVEGATEVYVSKEQDVLDIIRTGQSNRAIAFTKMNAESSRSHSIFVLNIAQKNLKDGSSKSGKLYLVDLAGSEKVGKTGAQGTTLDEAKMINKSLSALGNVINALTEGKQGHIPYRDSKLTRVLQESLGGNSRTTLIINCSPSSYNEAETLSTLRFGSRAKNIKNKAKVNQERSASELKALLLKAEAEIERLKAYIKGGGGGGSDPTQDDSATGGNSAELQEKCLDLEQRLTSAEDDKKGVQEQLDQLSDTLQEKETELTDSRLELDKLTREVQSLTKENGELSMQFADMKMAADRIRYESTEQALVIDSLTSENNAMRSEVQLLQDQVKTLEDEKALQDSEKGEDKKVATGHGDSKSNPVKRYSTEWALKEEQLKRELEEGFLSTSSEEVTEPPPSSTPTVEVQARITELEEAIKTKNETLAEEQRKHEATHVILSSQHSQLQQEHTDLKSQVQSKDTQIEQLKAKLAEQAGKFRAREQRDQQDQYRREQNAKWQERTLATGEEPPTDDNMEPTEPTETETELEEAHARAADYEQQLSIQASEIDRLIKENASLKVPSDSEHVDSEKYKELEASNKELQFRFDMLEQITKVNEEAGKAKLETEIKRLQNQTSVKLAEFASMRDALLLDLENRCQKVIDLEMLLDDAQDKYHNLLAQMKKAGGKQQHYDLLQQKLDLATSARHQLSIDNNKLKLDLQVATKQLALRDGHIASLESLLKDTQERFHKLAKGYETVADELAKFKEGSANSGIAGSVGSLFGRSRNATGAGGSSGNASGITDTARIARPMRGGGGHHLPPSSSSITAAISSSSPPPRPNGSIPSNSLTSLPPMPSPFSIANNYTTSSGSPLTKRPSTAGGGQDSTPSTPGTPGTPGTPNTPSYSQNSIWDIFRAKKTPKPGSSSSSSYPVTPSSVSSTPYSASGAATPVSPYTPSSPYTPVGLPPSPPTPASPPPGTNPNSYAPAVPTSPYVPSTAPSTPPRSSPQDST